MNIASATIEMHPHPRGERRFCCYCGAAHSWGEKGTRTFRIPLEKHRAFGYRMIRCACGVWHMQQIGAEQAENLIKEQA